SYVELSYSANLQTAFLQNRAGNFVLPDAHSMTEAGVGIDYPDDLRLSLINQSLQPDAYPLTISTWLVAYTDQKDPAKARALTHFLWWAIHDGQKYGISLRYAPLPPDLVRRDEMQIQKISFAGVPILAAPAATP